VLSARMCWGERREPLPDSFSIYPGRGRGYATAEGMCAAGQMGLFYSVFSLIFWFESPAYACMCCLVVVVTGMQHTSMRLCVQRERLPFCY
jgi:hypothetical protein